MRRRKPASDPIMIHATNLPIVIEVQPVLSVEPGDTPRVLVTVRQVKPKRTRRKP